MKINCEDIRDSLRNHLKAPRRQWVKFSIWGLIYIIFILWVGNLWWLLLLPLILDLFVTKYINWSWWRKYKESKPLIYTILSWIDAIVFALVAVYFINQYLFQNYQIPSSSLEKTMLRGDFLFVSKLAYGPRIPNTPLSMPLMQHTMPAWLGGGKSYIECPQWDYRRLSGLDTIHLGDIVVFNFPAGDTVALNMQNPDYYTLCYIYGSDRVHADKATFGDIVYRPVDRRENYVKRCVGLPGDVIEIRDNQVYRNGVIEADHDFVQYNYIVQTTGGLIAERIFEQMDIAREDQRLLNTQVYDVQEMLIQQGMDPYAPTYLLPLTKQNVRTFEANPNISRIVIEPEFMGGEVYPLGHNQWSRDNYGPIRIPRRNMTVHLDSSNYYLYERCIRNYERQQIEQKDGQIYINGQPTDSYTFQMNYFWMMGDNRHQSADSRHWGFVPEDHIVGRPVFIWLSLDPEKSLFKGKIRWNRIFRSAHI
ncbi:MAG: signal peptidase I [Paludibacteraceae bacterium]|nr:signal peptidase I [Paludibacteraceae bacterium]